MPPTDLHIDTAQPGGNQNVVTVATPVQADEPLERCPYHGTSYTRDCPVCWQLSWRWYDEHIAPHRVLRVPPSPKRLELIAGIRRLQDELLELDGSYARQFVAASQLPHGTERDLIAYGQRLADLLARHIATDERPKRHKRRAASEMSCLDQPLRIGIINL